MKTILSLVLGLALMGLCSESLAQCRASGGGGGQTGGGGQIGGGGQGSSLRGGGQFGSQGQLLTGPGSYFHDLMVQNYRQQMMQRQQAAIAAAKQAKKDLRKGKQVDTRRAQREAELARREAKKRAASRQQNLYGSNEFRLVSKTR